MKNKLYKKRHKIKNKEKKINNFLGTLKFGEYGLKACSSGELTAKQVESMRRILVQVTRRIGKVKIRVFFQQPITKKPLHSRMGKGCGAVSA